MCRNTLKIVLHTLGRPHRLTHPSKQQTSAPLPQSTSYWPGDLNKIYNLYNRRKFYDLSHLRFWVHSSQSTRGPKKYSRMFEGQECMLKHLEGCFHKSMKLNKILCYDSQIWPVDLMLCMPSLDN